MNDMHSKYQQYGGKLKSHFHTLLTCVFWLPGEAKCVCTAFLSKNFCNELHTYVVCSHGNHPSFTHCASVIADGLILSRSAKFLIDSPRDPQVILDSSPCLSNAQEWLSTWIFQWWHGWCPAQYGTPPDRPSFPCTEWMIQHHSWIIFWSVQHG